MLGFLPSLDMNISNFTGGFSKPWNRSWLPGLVNVMLVSGLVLLLADWVQGFDDTPGSDAPQMHDTVMSTQPENESPDVVDTLVEAQLFDAVDDAGENQAQRPIQVPDTALDLFLKGIVATSDHRDGYAIIRSPDEQEWPFRTGDSVYGLATLEEIYIDRVILRRDGRYETLRLPIEFMAREHSGEEARKKEARRIVTDFREKLLARDGMALIRMFGFEETYGNGGFIGFTVKIVGEDGARMLEVLGVEEGDVITAVNGKRFAESLEAIESLRTLKDATEVDVEIDRQGAPMFFHFDFDQLDAAGAGEPKAASVVLEDAAVGAEESTTP